MIPVKRTTETRDSRETTERTRHRRQTPSTSERPTHSLGRHQSGRVLSSSTCERCTRLERECSRDLPSCTACFTGSAECRYGHIDSSSQCIVKLRVPPDLLRSTSIPSPESRNYTPSLLPEGATWLEALLPGQDPTEVPTLLSLTPREILTASVHSWRPAFQLPSLQIALTLAEAFFASTGTAWPVLDRRAFEDLLNFSYTSPASVPDDKLYVVCMVMSTAAAALEWAHVVDRQQLGNDRQAYYTQAQEYARNLTRKRDLETLEAVLLECLHAIFAPQAQSSLWTLVAQAGRHALDLGLHKGAGGSRGARLFWTFYTLDRTISAVLNRPVLLREEDVQRDRNELVVIYSGGDITDDDRCSAVNLHLRKLWQLKWQMTTPREDHLQDAIVWHNGTPALPSEAAVLLTPLDQRTYYEECLCEMQLDVLAPSSHADKPFRARHASMPTAEDVLTDNLVGCAIRRLGLFADRLGIRKYVITWWTVRSVFWAILVLMHCLSEEAVLRTEPAQLRDMLGLIVRHLEVISSRWNAASDIQAPLAHLVTRYLALYIDDDATRPSTLCDKAIRWLVVDVKSCYSRGYPPGAERLARAHPRSYTPDPDYDTVLSVARWHDELLHLFT
ncbi:hypothetical protein PYCC9005_005853 [Savitreella phatthalungensis]